METRTQQVRTSHSGIDRIPYGLYGQDAAEDGVPESLRKSAEEARGQWPELLTAAEHGQRTIITTHGRPVALLVPVSAGMEVDGQRSLLRLVGSGRGLYGEDGRLTMRELRDEWER